MKGLVVFDVDGTILDSFGLFQQVVAEYSQDMGLPHPCLETIKRGYADCHNHDFKWGVSREEQEKHLIETFKLTDVWSLSGEAGKTPVLFSGVKEGLVQLKDHGHTLAIVTSKGEAALLYLLEHHGITKLFSAHRAWDDIARRGEKEKPAPDMLQSVMRDLKFVPDETVMIGDTTMDMKMGRAAQTGTIGVTWGSHQKDHLEDAGAHHIIETHFDDVVLTVGKILV